MSPVTRMGSMVPKVEAVCPMGGRLPAVAVGRRRLSIARDSTTDIPVAWWLPRRGPAAFSTDPPWTCSRLHSVETPGKQEAENKGKAEIFPAPGRREGRRAAMRRATAADGGGSTARGLSVSVTARSKQSWATGWRRGSRRADRADAGAEARGPGVPSPRERAPVAVRPGAFDGGLSSRCVPTGRPRRVRGWRRGN